MKDVNLETCIVRVESLDGCPQGTGFVLTPTLAVTCAHVVQACGVGPGNQIRLTLYAGSTPAEAEVLADGCRPDADVAFLRLAAPLPSGVSPAVLGPSVRLDDHRFRTLTLGYPHVGEFQGVRASGEILGQVTDQRGVVMLQLRSQEIAPGMSGAPVIDVDANLVVGMVTMTYQPDATLKFRDAAFAIPVETLRAVPPPSRTGRTLHAVACHACLFAPETSCERGNKYLDRSTLMHTVERDDLAFFE